MDEKKKRETSSAEADHNINVEQQDAPVQDKSEFPKFIPTGDELIELVKHWIKKDMDARYWFCLVVQAGGDLLLPARVNSRIAQIEEIVGSEKVQHAIEEAWYEFAKDKDPVLWHVFMRGTEEDWTKVLDHASQRRQF